MTSFWKRLLTTSTTKKDHEQRIAHAQAARLTYYRTLGTNVEEPNSPDKPNSPAWPAQQAWRRIRNGSSTILVTDGLSSPFPEKKPNHGFGLEILVETSDPIAEDYEATWLFHILYQVAQNVAHHGSFRKLIDQHQVGMLEIASTPELAPFQNNANMLGIFLGLHTHTKHDTINYDTTDALIVTAKLLTLPEFEYAKHNQALGYQLLRERFLSNNSNHISSLKRESVI